MNKRYSWNAVKCVLTTSTKAKFKCCGKYQQHQQRISTTSAKHCAFWWTRSSGCWDQLMWFTWFFLHSHAEKSQQQQQQNGVNCEFKYLFTIISDDFSNNSITFTTDLRSFYFCSVWVSVLLPWSIFNLCVVQYTYNSFGLYVNAWKVHTIIADVLFSIHWNVLWTICACSSFETIKMVNEA